MCGFQFFSIINSVSNVAIEVKQDYLAECASLEGCKSCSFFDFPYSRNL